MYFGSSSKFKCVYTYFFLHSQAFLYLLQYLVTLFLLFAGHCVRTRVSRCQKEVHHASGLWPFLFFSCLIEELVFLILHYNLIYILYQFSELACTYTEACCIKTCSRYSSSYWSSKPNFYFVPSV